MSTRSQKYVLLALACLGYALTILVISVFYHHNDSVLVLFWRCWQYLKHSWVGFAVALISGYGLFFKSMIKGSIHLLYIKSILACLWISYVTAIAFFVVSVFFLNDLALNEQIIDASILIYILQVSTLGVMYSLPVLVTFAFVATRVIKTSNSID